MMTKPPTPKQIARAWHGIPHEYGTRRNKALDGKQWEVYAYEIDEPISDDSVKVLAVYSTQSEAEDYRDAIDDDARAKAVLALFKIKS